MTAPHGDHGALVPDAPIFIVGSMRSGSTLLRLILDSHERIAIGPESGFMRSVPAIKTIPGWRSGRGWYERFGLTEADLNAHIARFYGGIFAARAKAQGKARWGDKTPFHTLHMDEIAMLFDDAVFVGIVRHPGAVAASLRRRGQSFTQAVETWVRYNSKMVRVGEELGDRLGLVRYEDLVARPEPVLRQLLEFLHEPWSPALLHHHEVQRGKGAPTVADGGTRPGAPISAERADSWRSELGPGERRVLEQRTGPLAALFGYRPDAAQPFPAGDQAPLPDGVALARRRRAQGLVTDEALRAPLRPAGGTGRGASRQLAAGWRLLRSDPGYGLRRLLDLSGLRAPDRHPR